MIPIMLVTVAYMVGILWGLYLNVNLGMVLFFISIYVSVFLKNKKIVWILIIIIAIGSIYTLNKKHIYEEKYAEGIISLTGYITFVPKQDGYYNKYVLKSKGDKFLIYLEKEDILLQKGDVVNIKGFFSKPQSKRNTGGFNYAYYMYSQGEYGTIKVIPKNVVITDRKNNYIFQIQDSIKQNFSSIIPKNDAGIIIGMMIGDVDYIDENTINNFETSGLTHLLAVSGSNIAYVVLVVKFLFDKITGKNISNYITIIFIIVFIFISGASASVVRAGIMAIIAIFSTILSKKPNIYSGLSLSALLILIYNPFTICDASFVLSYGGTLGIIFLNTRMKGFLSKYVKSKIIAETLAVTMSAQIMLFPILVHYFNKISLYAIFTNLIVAPLIGYLTIIGMGSFFISQISKSFFRVCGYILYPIIQIVTFISSIFSDLPFSQVTIPTFNEYEIIIYYAIVAVITLKDKIKHRILISVFLCLLFFIPQIIPRNYLMFNVIDVGQGDSIYIQTQNDKVILIDGGGSENYEIGENVILPYLHDMGQNYIDIVIISHFHMDHVGGIIDIMGRISIGKIIVNKSENENQLYNEFEKKCIENNVEIVDVEKYDKFIIDDVMFDVIVAESGDENENNNSIGLKISYGDVKIITCGDIEESIENKIRDDIDANILKVSHHGSSTSSSETFVKRISPEISIISVGKNNYGHPADKVKELLHEHGEVFTTRNSGEVMLKIYKNGKIRVNTCIK